MSLLKYFTDLEYFAKFWRSQFMIKEKRTDVYQVPSMATPWNRKTTIHGTFLRKKK
jgi:hypothetical protein